MLISLERCFLKFVAPDLDFRALSITTVVLNPRDFLKFFGDLDIPKVLYEGKVNQEFIASVKDCKLEGMTLEGVVCKGSNPKKPRHRVMFKLKSDEWMAKLRAYCGDNVGRFNELV